jgi:cyclopropane-fatty-acyl-phospholipid synthase
MTTRELLSEELSRDHAASGVLGMAERGWLPDWAIRAGIRRFCAQRLREEEAGGVEEMAARASQRLTQLRQSLIAIQTEAANSQHYELPAALFQQVLGRRLKYSCAYYPTGRETLDEAEDAMLALYAARAELADGQDILELGCGWGSLTLWMAQNYPRARITAVSNSSGQRAHIESECRQRGLSNVRVITQDVNRLELPADRFDRCLSIEMFEHMRNYETLLERIGGWLRAGGKLFAHLFVHRIHMYPFETTGEDNWLGRHFFTGGLMPAADTLLWFQRSLRIQDVWHVNGRHYERTANDWLRNQDARRDEVMRVMSEVYGAERATLWYQRWRIFWMSCAELFGYNRGQDWFVAHYLFSK